MKASEVKEGMRVTYGDFDGVIRDVCEWSRVSLNGVEDVLVNVRLPAGVACVGASELVEKGEVA